MLEKKLSLPPFPRHVARIEKADPSFYQPRANGKARANLRNDGFLILSAHPPISFSDWKQSRGEDGRDRTFLSYPPIFSFYGLSSYSPSSSFFPLSLPAPPLPLLSLPPAIRRFPLDSTRLDSRTSTIMLPRRATSAIVVENKATSAFLQMRPILLVVGRGREKVPSFYKTKPRERFLSHFTGRRVC